MHNTMGTVRLRRIFTVSFRVTSTPFSSKINDNYRSFNRTSSWIFLNGRAVSPLTRKREKYRMRESEGGGGEERGRTTS